MLSIFLLLPKWLFLSFKDFVRWLRHPVLKQKGGVWIFVGLYGSGKTISMVREALRLKKRFGSPVYSNFGLTWQDGTIDSWESLLSLPPGSVVLFDELGTLVDNYKFKSMPPDLFRLLSQNRKLRIRIMSTIQVFDDTVKKYRTLTKWIIECSMFGRLVCNRFYSQKEYARGDTVKRKSHSDYYLAEDSLFAKYDTLEVISQLPTTALGKLPP